MEQSSFIDIEAEFDPESVMYKSTTLAKYQTLDEVLERRHNINEA
jgi:hypothetical protein